MVDGLLDAARTGESRVVMVSGEPGIGKTALLRYAQHRATGMQVLRATGIESEAELEFSALADLCRPLLPYLEEFPLRQADTLRTVLGARDGTVGDRLSVGIATLGILTRAADERPLLVVLDDVQWVDQSSLDAILFACRRLSVDRIAVLLAARDDYTLPDALRGFPQLRLGGLVGPDVAALLHQAAGAPVAEQVAQRLHRSTQGNPLALTEISRTLGDDQLAGLTPIEEPLTVGSAVEHAFARRMGRLPADDRRALLVVAVSSSSGVDVIASALRAAALDVSALERSEDEGLIHLIDGRVQFDHPLIRSVIHQLARPSERRAAHLAVAKAFAESDSEQRAWHLAAATIAPDEEVAAALESAALVARDRSGYAAAAVALERAAALTPDASVRGARRHLAARAAWDAGRSARALELLEGALALPATATLRAEMLYLRGHIQHLTGPVKEAHESLVSAAALMENENPARAAEFLHDAAEALGYAFAPEDMLAAARRAHDLAPAGSGGRFLAEIRMGEALLYLGRWAEGVAYLERAVAMVPTEPDEHWSAFLMSNAALGLSWLNRRAEATTLVERAVAEARAQNALTALVYALEIEAWTRMRCGSWHTSYAVATEVAELARETGQSTQLALALSELSWVAAARGDAEACRAGVAEALALSRRKQLNYVALWARHCEALLEMSLGQFDAAIEALEPIERECRGAGAAGEEICTEPDLVEAYLCAGRRDEAQALLDRFDAVGVYEYGVYGEALVARCRGLLADDGEYRTHFARALTLHEALGDPFAAARTALLFGERLRRCGQRAEARVRLRAALGVFDTLGAGPWSARARGELRATGVTVRRHDSAVSELTPQELQVVLKVVTGKTNREVAAALFLSPKTVEFHLGSVFRKLGIRSRLQLAGLFVEQAQAG